MNEHTVLALEASDLDVHYKAAAVLRGLTLKVAHGEIYALLGGNGAGKSTTLNAFLGFLRPSGGAVKVCGLNPVADPIGVRAKLAYVPENVALYEHLTARENIIYFLRLAGGRAITAEGIEQALTAVNLDPIAWDRTLSGFSKGMRQKVAIALAVARSVPVLLLDEPTTGLDPQATNEFNTLLKALKGKNVAIFMVTHDLLSAAEVADRIGFLDHGKIIEEFVAAGAERFDVRALYKHYATGRIAA